MDDENLLQFSSSQLIIGNRDPFLKILILNLMIFDEINDKKMQQNNGRVGSGVAKGAYQRATYRGQQL